MVAGIMIFIFGMWSFVLVALVYSMLSRIIRTGMGKSMRASLRSKPIPTWGVFSKLEMR